MRVRMIVVVLLIAAAACGCSSTSSSQSSSSKRLPARPVQPVDGFAVNLVRTEWLNQFPLVYSWLDASQRTHIQRARFEIYEVALQMPHPAGSVFVTARPLSTRRIRLGGLP